MIEVVNQFQPEEESSLATLFHTTVFLAGGISHCKDWQSEVIKRLYQIDEREKIKGSLRVYNPREEYNPANKEYSIEERIKWDYTKMENSNIFTAYLTNESTQGSTLFEIGRYIARMEQHYSSKEYWKHLVVSIEAGYNHKEKLVAYLKMIFENNYDLIVEEDSSPTLHAARIYTMYILHNGH